MIYLQYNIDKIYLFKYHHNITIFKTGIFTQIIFLLSLTSAFANLPVASPEYSDKGGSVMRSGLDVVILSKEDVVTVFHAAETRNTHTNTQFTISARFQLISKIKQ